MEFMGFLGNKLQTILMYFEMVLTKLILYACGIFYFFSIIYFFTHSSYSWVNLEVISWDLNKWIVLCCYCINLLGVFFWLVCTWVISFLRSWSSSCNIMGWEGCTWLAEIEIYWIYVSAKVYYFVLSSKYDIDV